MNIEKNQDHELEGFFKSVELERSGDNLERYTNEEEDDARLIKIPKDKTKEYGAEQIVVLEGLEGARKNPGMYIGNTDDGSGLHKMLDEILDNAIDEAQIECGRQCDLIEVFINKDNSIYISDNGRGIPVEVHKKVGKPTVEVVMTNLHAGGKFKGDKAGGAYEQTGGLHGVGASVVNALSDFMEVIVWRDQREYCIRFEQGKTVRNLYVSSQNPSRSRGTAVHFLPSAEIFGQILWDAQKIKARIKEAAFLNPNVTFIFQDRREEGNNELLKFNYPKGIVDFIDQYISDFNFSLDPENKLESEKLLGSLHEVIHIRGVKNEVNIDCAFLWCNNLLEEENITCFTNNIKQIGGGSHLIGIRGGISKALLSYIEQYAGKKEKGSITAEDVREGLLGIICVKISNPKFSSQTKEVLINKEVRSAVEDLVQEKLSLWLDSNAAYAKNIIARVFLNAQAREAAKRARDTKRNEKSIFENNILPGKLASCQTRDPMQAEIFIVEGNSAGGSAKQGRNRENQAILALRGKILNVEKVKYEKMITSAEICALITALGAGIGRSFDIDKIKYHKIIIMTDADVDGYHIKTLLLTFFFRHMCEIIERGYLYIAQPPLYKIKIGQKESYIKNDEILKEYLIEHFLNNNKILISHSYGENFNVIDNEFLNKILVVFERISQHLNLSCSENPQLAEKIFKIIINDHINVLSDVSQLKSLEEKLNYMDSGWQYKIELQNDLVSKNIYLNVNYVVQNVNYNVKIVLNEFIKGENQLRFSNLDQVSNLNDLSNGLINDSIEIDINVEIYQIYQKAFSYLANGGIEIELKNHKKLILNSVYEFVQVFSGLIREGLTIQRFKGLGEMNSDQLWKTAMDPKNRQLLQVSIEDSMKADEMFTVLMGDNVDLRRAFIEESEYLMDEIDT